MNAADNYNPIKYTPEQLIDIEAEREFYERRLKEDFWVRPSGICGGESTQVFIRASDRPRVAAVLAHHGPILKRLCEVFKEEPPKWKIFAHRQWEKELASVRAGLGLGL